MRRLIRKAHPHPDKETRWVLEHRLLSSVRTDNSTGSVKKNLSGVRLLERVGWLQSLLVRRGDRPLLEAMERQRAHEAATPQQQWAWMEAIRRMANMADTFGDWEVVALAAISCGLLLCAAKAG